MKSKGKLLVSFDFDTTLFMERVHQETGVVLVRYLNEHGKRYLDAHEKADDKIIIVTSRFDTEESRQEIFEFTYEFSLPIQEVHFTNMNMKVDTLKNLGVDIHYDDDRYELVVLGLERNGTEAISGVWVPF